MSDSLLPHGQYSTWNSPGQNTGEVAFPFSRASSQPRNRTQSPTLQVDSLTAEPQVKPSHVYQVSSVQFSHPVLSNSLRPMNHSTSGLPDLHHQLPESTQTHVHRVGDAIQPSHPLSSPSPPAPNPSQHQSLFQ